MLEFSGRGQEGISHQQHSRGKKERREERGKGTTGGEKKEGRKEEKIEMKEKEKIKLSVISLKSK